MLGYSLWQRRFGGDPQIVGKTIRLGTLTHIIIGVLPTGLKFPEETVDLWIPLEQTITPENMHWRNSHYLDVYARIKPGVTLAQARAEMNQIAAGLKLAYHDTNSGAGTYIIPVQEDLVSDIRPALLTLLVAVGFVLLIACANVANLLLVRATGREKEMSIRLALGAGSFRLVRQMLTESILLSVAGGAAGLLVAGWARQALLELRPMSLPRYNAIETDTRVLIFTLAISIVTGILFGLVPALRAARSDLNLALRGTSRGATAGVAAHRLRNAFVAGEIAISLVLLVGAGLLIRSFIRLRGNDLGFSTDHIVTARVSIPQDKYPQGPQVVAFYDQLVARVRALPGAEAVGATSFLPLTGHNFDNSFDIVGRPVRPPSDRTYALIRFADSQYFHVLQIPILRGRGIEDRDRQGAPRAVVITDAMATYYWPSENPIGQHLTVYMGVDQSPWEVVGIVRDVRTKIAAEPEPMIYFPYAQSPYRYMVLTVRTQTDPKAMIEAIRGVARGLDPDQPLSQIRTLDELMTLTLVPWRFSMTLLASFAALALVLAAAGIYGVISYTVGQRSSEIGIRMALGAQSRDVLRLILRQGMGVALAGIAAGLGGAFYLTRFLTTQLYGVRPTDALTFATIPVLLAAVALAASYIPARRATRVDPMIALRYE
jgi:putative ABC transport system permease protein